MSEIVDPKVVVDPRKNLNVLNVLIVADVQNNSMMYEIYNKLVSEIKNCGIPEEQLLKMWHGNDKIEGTHLIANDRSNWKERCPTFNMVISRLKDVFKMDIKATRLNWYRDPDHWKAFHFDASAVKSEKIVWLSLASKYSIYIIYHNLFNIF